MVSSFGAEAAVLLKMVADIDRDLPVLMIDSLLLFEETLDVPADAVGASRACATCRSCGRPRWTWRGSTRTTRCTSATPTPAATSARCCRSTGRCGAGRCRSPGASGSRPRRGSRSTVFEAEGERLKVNPLAHWSAAELRAYMDRHDLPRHPLVAQGLQVDRLLAVHDAGRRRRGRARRALARHRRRSSAASISARTAGSCARRAEEGDDDGAGDRGGLRAGRLDGGRCCRSRSSGAGRTCPRRRWRSTSRTTGTRRTWRPGSTGWR